MSAAQASKTDRFRICCVSTVATLVIGAVTLQPCFAAVTVTTAGKTRTTTSITSGAMRVCVTVGVPGPAGVGGPAPATFPTYSLDLYDDDWVFDDATGADSTAPPPACTGWTLSKVVTMAIGTSAHWQCCWNVASITVAASDASGFPDPRIEVSITGPGSRGATGNTVDIGAPDVAPVSLQSLDLGLTGPSLIANSSVLFGQPVAAFSRGYDDISELGTSAHLFFASDAATQTLSPSVPLNEGQVFVLSSDGELWPEQAFGVGKEPGDFVGTVRYINVNRSASVPMAATDEMYIVLQDTSEILYTPDADLANTSSFLDLGLADAVTGLAVEDGGVRGTWDSTDRILYSIEGSPAIYQLDFGGVADFLDVDGALFDGSTTLVMDHLDGGEAPSLTVGDITALAVTESSAAFPEPSDFRLCDVTDSLPPTLEIPTVSPPVLVVFSLLLLATALLVLRHRRSAR